MADDDDHYDNHPDGDYFSEESYYSEDETNSSHSYSTGGSGSSASAEQSDTMRDTMRDRSVSDHPQGSEPSYHSNHESSYYTSESYSSRSRSTASTFSQRSLASRSSATTGSRQNTGSLGSLNNDSQRSAFSKSSRSGSRSRSQRSMSNRSPSRSSSRMMSIHESSSVVEDDDVAAASESAASSHATSYEDQTVSSSESHHASENNSKSSRSLSRRSQASSFEDRTMGSGSVSTTRSRVSQQSASQREKSLSRRTEESTSQKSISQRDDNGGSFSSRRTDKSRSTIQSLSQRSGDSASMGETEKSRSHRSNQSLSQSSRSRNSSQVSSRKSGLSDRCSQRSNRQDSYRSSTVASEGNDLVSETSRSNNGSSRSNGNQSASKSQHSREYGSSFSVRSERSNKHSGHERDGNQADATNNSFGFGSETSPSHRSAASKSSRRSGSAAEISVNQEEDRSRTSESQHGKQSTLGTSRASRKSQYVTPPSPFGSTSTKSSKSGTSRSSIQIEGRNATPVLPLGSDSSFKSAISSSASASITQRSSKSAGDNSSNHSSEKFGDSFASRDKSRELAEGKTSSMVSEDPSKQAQQSTSERSDFHSTPQGVPGTTRLRVNGTHSIAVLGTMSDAGKSMIAAGICRILANNNTRVAPFNARNMSNCSTAALLPDKDRRDRLYHMFERDSNRKFPSNPISEKGYGEIGAAQSLQAEACKIPPRVEMNPIIFKSSGKNNNNNGERACSVVVLGRQIVPENHEDLDKRTASLRHLAVESHRVLVETTGATAVVVDGAGSCTELNNMDSDIANIPLVRTLRCPWLLVANNEPGGVFAQVVGTRMCVPEQDWEMCVGVVVNKLRGQDKDFEPGPTILERMVGKPVFVVPFLNDLHLPKESGLGIEQRLAWETHGRQHNENKENKPVVVVVAYAHTLIADDLFPLEQDERFHVEWRRRHIPKPYPATTAVILPGSQLVMKDLKWLFDSGWAAFIRRHRSAGGVILGLCGGYQMLGRSLADPDAANKSAGARQGIGLFPISTTIAPPVCNVVTRKMVQLYPSGIHVEGFELHCGVSKVLPEQLQSLGRASGISPLLAFEDGRPEGMRLGTVKGTYLHGILRSAKARVELLVPDPKAFPSLKSEIPVEDPLDRFANHLESCGLDYKKICSMIFGSQQENDRENEEEEASDQQ